MALLIIGNLAQSTKTTMLTGMEIAAASCSERIGTGAEGCWFVDVIASVPRFSLLQIISLNDAYSFRSRSYSSSSS